MGLAVGRHRSVRLDQGGSADAILGATSVAPITPITMREPSDMDRLTLPLRGLSILVLHAVGRTFVVLNIGILPFHLSVRVPFRRPLRRYGHFGLPLLRAELQKGCDVHNAYPALEPRRKAVVGLSGPLEIALRRGRCGSSAQKNARYWRCWPSRRPGRERQAQGEELRAGHVLEVPARAYSRQASSDWRAMAARRSIFPYPFASAMM